MNVLRTNREILHASWKLFQVNESTYLIVTFAYSPSIQIKNKRKNPFKGKNFTYLLRFNHDKHLLFLPSARTNVQFYRFTHNQAKFFPISLLNKGACVYLVFFRTCPLGSQNSYSFALHVAYFKINWSLKQSVPIL